jgi:hypothetical protein
VQIAGRFFFGAPGQAAYLFWTGVGLLGSINADVETVRAEKLEKNWYTSALDNYDTAWGISARTTAGDP